MPIRIDWISEISVFGLLSRNYAVYFDSIRDPHCLIISPASIHRTEVA